jgi:hypothetical protein
VLGSFASSHIADDPPITLSPGVQPGWEIDAKRGLLVRRRHGVVLQPFFVSVKMPLAGDAVQVLVADPCGLRRIAWRPAVSGLEIEVSAWNRTFEHSIELAEVQGRRLAFPEKFTRRALSQRDLHQKQPVAVATLVEVSEQRAEVWRVPVLDAAALVQRDCQRLSRSTIPRHSQTVTFLKPEKFTRRALSQRDLHQKQPVAVATLVEVSEQRAEVWLLGPWLFSVRLPM